MTLQELLRMFSGAADGQRMTNEPAGSMNNLSQGILSQPAQPSFTPSPQAAPQQRPQFTPAPVADPRVSPQLPIEAMNGSSPGPVASVMAGQDQPSQYTPPDLTMGPQQSPQGALNMPQYEQGILSKIGDFAKKSLNDSKTGVSPLEYLFRGLGAAGSQDPMKAMAQFAAQDTENAKVRAERLDRMKPKTVQIPGTAWFQTTQPDGTFTMKEDPQLAASLKDTTQEKVNAGVDRVLLQGRVTQANQQAAVDNKAGGEARSELSQVRETISSMERALEVAKTQGKTEQIFAIPGISAAAEFFGAPGAAGNKVLQELKVNDALRMTAQTKGAISNAEMSLFMSPAPNPTADREKVWTPWIENKISVFKRLEKALETTASRDQAPGSNLPTRSGLTNTPTGNASPAESSAGVSSPTSKAAYDALPAGTQYVAPDGKTYTKR